MNALLKTTIWIMVYAALGVMLCGVIRFMVKAITARTVKIWLGRRSVAAAVGLALSVICAVFGFSRADYHKQNTEEWKSVMGIYFYRNIDAYSERYPEEVIDDPVKYTMEQTSYAGYWWGAHTAAGAVSVAMGVFFLISGFGGLYFITERGVLRKGMINPEEITAELRGDRINIYLTLDEIRTKPFKVFKATQKNLKRLERFIEKEDRQDLFVVGG
ncbi:MAG: hypothetical protein K2O14_10580 [Oscillospiraceae bacterium]|nr:hypothetical protein [Oscillospiraceae bacterium]